jgi:hypothetical protein
MGTVLFVHGTGVRRAAYESTLDVVRERISKMAPGTEVRGCLWGDSCGVSFRANGKSVPGYATARGVAGEDMVAIWDALYADPFVELRLFAETTRTREGDLGSPIGSGDLKRRIDQLNLGSQGQAVIDAAAYADVWASANDRVRGSPELKSALASGETELELRGAIARAFVAETIVVAREAGRPILDAESRATLVTDVSDQLGGVPRSAKARFLRFLARPVLRYATSAAVRKRGALSDSGSPIAGDVLLYQVRGDAIRKAIGDAIADAREPVTLLAHSLGGIACVDLLAYAANERVARLITVGSQAPLLYELGALWSMSWGTQLPQHFPPWTNVWDKNDLLSYLGAEIFAGRVSDVEVNSRQPFPESHSAYWLNPATWEAVKTALP